MTPNPFISHLNRYTTASPDHEAAFDEFITQVPPPSGVALRLVESGLVEGRGHICARRYHLSAAVYLQNRVRIPTFYR